MYTNLMYIYTYIKLFSIHTYCNKEHRKIQFESSVMSTLHINTTKPKKLPLMIVSGPKISEKRQARMQQNRNMVLKPDTMEKSNSFIKFFRNFKF